MATIPKWECNEDCQMQKGNNSSYVKVAMLGKLVDHPRSCVASYHNDDALTPTLDDGAKICWGPKSNIKSWVVSHLLHCPAGHLTGVDAGHSGQELAVLFPAEGQSAVLMGRQGRHEEGGVHTLGRHGCCSTRAHTRAHTPTPTHADTQIHKGRFISTHTHTHINKSINHYIKCWDGLNLQIVQCVFFFFK